MNYFIFLIVMLLLLSTFVVGQRNNGPPPQGVKLSATGVATGVPDAASIRFTVSVKEKSSEKAFKEASSVAATVREAVYSLGAQEKALKTQNLHSHPEYKYVRDEEPRIIAYRSSQTFIITIDDPSKAGAYVGAIIKAGENHVTVDSVNTFIMDKDALAKEARTVAVANALNKAQDYARLLGVALGAPESIIELNAPQSRSRGKMMRANFAAEMAVADEGPPAEVDLGEQEVSVSIEVRWGLAIK